MPSCLPVRSLGSALPLLLPALLGAAGCSLVNEPDLGFLDVDASFPDAAGDGDGDVDGDVDADVDADADADGDADAEPEVCSGGVVGADEDLDLLADCADPDCFDDLFCCPRLGTIVDEDFLDEKDAPAWDTGEWVAFDADDPPVPSDSLRIDFGPGNGLFARERVDMSYGLHVELVVSPRGAIDDEACESLAGCPDHVGVALTPVAEYTPGVELPAILHVAVTASGEILVVRGGRVRARLVSGWAASDHVEVAIDVLPSGQGGQRGFRVLVAPTGDSDAQFDAWELDELILTEADNVGADGMRGAWLALVGRTENGGFTTIHAGASFLGCDNPAVFVPSPQGPLTGSSLGLGGWAEGAIGSPGAADAGSGEVRMLFDASDLDLGLERYRLVPRAIGEANRTDDGQWSALDAPVFGTNPPSADASSTREPALLATDPTRAWMATASADAAGTFAIAVAGRVGTWSEPTTILSIADVPELVALRAPAVAQVHDDEPSLYHLWFVGVTPETPETPASTALWHAVGDTDFGPGSVEPPTRVLTEQDVGFRAARGLFEPIVAWDEVRRVFLIWFLAEDALGRRTLHHGIAPESGEGIVLYDGNPILDPQDPVLGTCDEGCSLRGGTVFDDGGRRTFLFARSAGTETPVHEIVTVTQQVGGE